MDQTALIQAVVKEVLAQLGGSAGGGRGGARAGAFGVYRDVDAAVGAAKRAQEQLVRAGVKARDAICRMIKDIAIGHAEEWGKIEMEETKVGRLDHKVEKLKWLAGVPGVEFLKTVAHSGDDGIGLDEGAPWGVIGVVTPVTHSIPTLSANAINMIAAGNSLVINAHPSGYKCAVMAVRTYNQAIAAKFGIEDAICIIEPPTLESANALFEHRDVPLLVITGGPMVARAAMAQKKRAVVGGPGNPPVVVDETADLDEAAKAIIAGGSFDNNLLCIAEKEVFVVEKVFDKMMEAMARHGALRLNSGEIEALTKKAFVYKDALPAHWAVRKELVGRDPIVLAEAAGNAECGMRNAGGKRVELLYGETGENNPFVAEEQMMPFVPFVRVKDFEEGLRLAVKHEHGFGHTAMIHSHNLENITRMGRVMNTTLFVVNGPCTAALGGGGEGYPSYTIATPTGEGVTNPMTFTRFRRLTMAGALRVV